MALVFRTLGKIRAEARVFALMIKAKMGGLSKEELVGLFTNDSSVDLRLRSFGSKRAADPELLVDSLGKRLQVPQGFFRRILSAPLRSLTRRAIASELDRAGVPFDQARTVVDGLGLDGASAGALRRVLENNSSTVLIPPGVTAAQLSALLVLAATFNGRLTFVMQEGDSNRAVLEGLVARMGPEDARRFKVRSALRPFGGDAEHGFTLAASGLPPDVPLQNLRALGPVTFSDRTDLAIVNLLLFLPRITLRAETMLNLRAIAVVLAAA